MRDNQNRVPKRENKNCVRLLQIRRAAAGTQHAEKHNDFAGQRIRVVRPNERTLNLILYTEDETFSEKKISKYSIYANIQTVLRITFILYKYL